jgi:hypothetical protein
MNRDTANALRKAAEHLKSGDTKAARSIVLQILRDEPENIQAWYILSFSVPRKDKQIQALQQLLQLDPNNEKAINRLQKLGGSLEGITPSISSDSPEEAVVEEEQIPEPPTSVEQPPPTEDLLTQRLLGGPSKAVPASPEHPVPTEPPEEKEITPDIVPQTSTLPESEEQELLKKFLGLSRRTRIFLIVTVIFIGLTFLFIAFKKPISGLLTSLTQSGDGVDIEVTSGSLETIAPEETLETTAPQSTPAEVVLTPTTTLPNPTAPPIIFSNSDLLPPNEDTLAAMLEIQDQISSKLELPQDYQIESFPISESQMQSFVREFAKLPGMTANTKQLHSLFLSLGLAQIIDDYNSFYLNTWVDPNGTIYFPKEEFIAITGFDFGVYQKFSYAQAYVQHIRNSQFSFENLSAYPPCDLTLESCEVITALIKGEAAAIAMEWARENFSEDEVVDITNSTKKIYFIPIQSATNLMEQIRLFPYEYGYAFVEAVFENGGLEALNSLYEIPPSTTEQIIHPEKYIQGETAVQVESTDLTSLVTPGYTEQFSGSLGEWKSFLLLTYGTNIKTRLMADEAKIAAAGWGGDHMQIYSNPSSENIIVGHWTFDSLTDSQEFLQAIEHFVTNLVSGKDVSVGEYQCNQSNIITCVASKDRDVIWFLTPDRDTMEEIIDNYSYLSKD